MKKKIIGSSILLVVLLLGLSTISFANITENQLKNYAVYIGVNKGGKTEQYMIDWFNTATWTNFYNAISNYIDNDSYDVFLYSQGSEIYFYYRASNTTSKLYIRDMSIYSVTAPNFNGRRVNTISTSANNSDNYNSPYVNNLKANSFYTDIPIYSSNSYTSITFPAGTCYPSSDIFDGPYEDIAPFSFIPETGLGIVSYNNYDYNLYEAPSSGDLLLGTLNIPNGIVVNYQDIINFYWRWNNWQERSLPSDIIKLRLLSSEEGNLSWAVYLTHDNIYNNTYYQYIWTSTQTEPFQFVSGGCYIKDSHTVIVDGIVDPYLTFSGDYSDEYNNNLELQDLKDTMQDQTDQLLDSSEVDSLLGKFGSSGDILEQFGYSPIENPFVVVIRNVFIGLNDVLLGSGNQTLDLSSFGMELVLHSDDFILPNNIIINFIHLICNGFFVYGLYKYGFQLIQWINTGRLQNLLDETTGHTHYLF